jgi:hypothetical protein
MSDLMKVGMFRGYTMSGRLDKSPLMVNEKIDYIIHIRINLNMVPYEKIPSYNFEGVFETDEGKEYLHIYVYETPYNRRVIKALEDSINFLYGKK